jgi:hypothetical protein
MAAVRQYGGALAYASDALKGDRDIVMAAISQYGWALIHADAAFVKDPEMRAIAYSDRI